ncbi:protein kinase [Streptomyces sp. NPDC060209]|uniref:protein kinase domain-containing protein n=1 Tax=Streptomyces sp. NPDC060209 TaxID=3347073 RepID=UPI003651403F
MLDRAPTPPSYWAKDEIVDGRYTVLDARPKEGGMGLVYRVRHNAWRTVLALKCPKPEHFRSDESRQRFITEAETWVKLGLHPHVCSCHYVRRIGEVPCVFAEYAAGGSLREWIDDRRLYEGGRSKALARIMDMAIQVAWGLEHADSRGLVHQDVKPDNVVLDEYGTAKVTDFGLAQARAAAAGTRPASADPDATARPGPRPGVTATVPNGGLRTREYASPEQIAGLQLDRRTDVYSFGVSVFEMFRGGVTWLTGPAVGRALADYRPADSSDTAWLPPLPGPLASLLKRCLADARQDRPRSMTEVARELVGMHHAVTGFAYPRAEPAEAGLLADEFNNRALSLLDLARTPEEAEKRKAESERTFLEALEADPRHPGATYNLAMLRWRQGAVTDEEAVTALEAVRADTDDPWQARQLLAQVHLERGDLVTAGELLEKVARERHDEPEVRTALSTVRAGRVRTTFRRLRYEDKPKTVSSHMPVRVTPDGRLAVTGEWGPVRLWDLTNGRSLRTLEGHSKDGRGTSVRSVDLTPDGRFAVSAGDDKTVRFWDLRDGQCLRTLDEQAHGVRLTPDGGLALWGWSDGTLRLWDTRSGELTTTSERHAEGAEQVEVSADGRWALSVGWERRGPSLRLWNLHGGHCEGVLTAYSSPVIGLCFRPDGRTAVTAHQDRTITLWDLHRGLPLRTMRGSVRGRLMSIGSDGRFLLTGDDTKGDAQFWDLEAGRCLRTYRDIGLNALLVDASDHSGLAVASGTLAYGDGDDDRRSGVYAWELDLPSGRDAAPPHLSEPRPHTELRSLDGQVATMVADAERAMAAGRLSTARRRLTEARRLSGYERAPRVMDAWRELSRRAIRTRLRTAWPARTMAVSEGAVYGLALTPDGRHALVGGSDGNVGLWDVRTGTRGRSFEGHQHAVRSVCLSADARRALSAGQDGTVRLWDVPSGQCLRVLHMYEYLPSPSVPVRWDAGGRQVVVGGGDGALRVWDLDTGGLARTLTGHEGAVHALWVGADGRFAASAGSDSTLRLWDLAEGRCVHVLEGHQSSVTMVCADADGASLLSCDTGYNRTIRLWDTTTGRQMREFEKGQSANALCVTADGRFAFSAGHGSRISLWEVGTGRCLRALDSHANTATTCLAVTPDGLTAVSGDDDGTLRSWLLDWELDTREPAAGPNLDQ